VVATKTGVDAVHLLKSIDEFGGRQFMRAEPAAQIEKRSDNT
jgi:hypothetical protein